MSEQTSERRNDASPTARERDRAAQIQAFVDEYPLLSLAFMAALGYAAGRIISKL